MKQGTTRRFLAAALVLPAAAMVGCSRQADLVETGAVTLRKVDAAHVRIAWAEVRRDGDAAVATGSLIPQGTHSRTLVGHVDVDRVAPDGRLLHHDCSPPVYLSSRGPGKGRLSKRFQVRLASPPAAGSVLRVRYEPGARCQHPPRRPPAS